MPKILIVDDEAHIRRLIERTLVDLEEAGVELLAADNGQDALDMILAEKPDLVFLDAMMPKMNGFDVCRAIKHDHQMDQVFIVMLTAKGQEYDRQRGEDVGVNVYTTKPFDPDQLLSLATQVLKLS